MIKIIIHMQENVVNVENFDILRQIDKYGEFKTVHLRLLLGSSHEIPQDNVRQAESSTS